MAILGKINGNAPLRFQENKMRFQENKIELIWCVITCYLLYHGKQLVRNFPLMHYFFSFSEWSKTSYMLIIMSISDSLAVVTPVNIQIGIGFKGWNRYFHKMKNILNEETLVTPPYPPPTAAFKLVLLCEDRCHWIERSCGIQYCDVINLGTTKGRF